jgi:hypothetical protein
MVINVHPALTANHIHIAVEMEIFTVQMTRLVMVDVCQMVRHVVMMVITVHMDIRVMVNTVVLIQVVNVFLQGVLTAYLPELHQLLHLLQLPYFQHRLHVFHLKSRF